MRREAPRRAPGRGPLRPIVLAALAACLGGCGSELARDARTAEPAALRPRLLARHARGQIGDGEAERIAHAVLERDLARAGSGLAAARALRDLQACAPAIEGLLEDRLEGEGGGEAALALQGAGLLSTSTARGYGRHPDEAFRAAWARVLVRDDERAARVAAVVDPAPRVRRAALEAIAEARDVGSLEAVFEAARVDPEPIVRTEAVRALSALGRAADRAGRGAEVGRDLAVRFRDLWNVADEALREDLAVAFALDPVYGAGGREALRARLAEGAGPGAVAAAGVLARGPASRDDDADRDLRATAEDVLVRAMAHGSARDRLHAVAVAPLAGRTLAAITEASRAPDPDVRVAGLARLLEHEPSSRAAREGLLRFAALPDDDRGDRARQALALRGDRSVQAWIERGLDAKEPRRRLAALVALVSLDRKARAAPLLVDADEGVRRRASCALLARR